MAGHDQDVHFMNRGAFLKSLAGAGALTAAGGFAVPAVSQRAAARVLRLVPHADVANFDPIWSSAYIARNAGLLVWDMLYGVDATLKVQRQMVEGRGGVGGRPHLDVSAAARAQVPRRRAGFFEKTRLSNRRALHAHDQSRKQVGGRTGSRRFSQ
jgi:hypothetical protein